MNQKAEKFDLLIADLNKGGNSWFTKEEMTDDLHTVVFDGRVGGVFRRFGVCIGVGVLGL